MTEAPQRGGASLTFAELCAFRGAGGRLDAHGESYDDGESSDAADRTVFVLTGCTMRVADQPLLPCRNHAWIAIVESASLDRQGLGSGSGARHVSLRLIKLRGAMGCVRVERGVWSSVRSVVKTTKAGCVPLSPLRTSFSISPDASRRCTGIVASRFGCRTGHRSTRRTRRARLLGSAGA